MLATLFWIVGALNVRGYIPSFSKSASLYVSRLETDPTTLRGRQLVSHINKVARQYNLPKASLLHRAFSSDAEAASWLREEDASALVIRGTPNWLRVVFDTSFNWFPSPSKTVLDTGVQKLMQDLGLVDGHGVRAVAAQGQRIPLLVVELPEGADLPSEPIELSQHYLAWMGNAFSPKNVIVKKFPTYFEGKLGADNQLAIGELRSSFLHLASDVQGEWRSSEPRALALFLRGTKELLEAGTGDNDAATLDCAMNLLTRAQRILQPEHAAEVYAAVNNNLAVACMLHEARPFYCQMMLRWLREASEVVDQNGQLVRGAKAAYINLLALRREGLY